MLERSVKVTGNKTALKQLVNKPFLDHPKYKQQQGRCVRDGTHPDLLLFEKALIKEFKRRGMPFFTHEMMRDEKRQQMLFVKGRSKSKYGQSPHNYGLAMDTVHSVLGWQLDAYSWEIVGHLGKEVANRLCIKIDWGGDWEFYDPAHWQLSDWKQKKDWNNS